jgi:transcriptional regulator with XRE-family HTH domain
MASATSYYHRRPGRFAKEKREFRRLVEELKKRADERGYTRQQIASELTVSLTCINQWWFGRTLTAKPERLERLKKFLSDD